MISNERRWPSHLQTRPQRFEPRPNGLRPPSSAGTLESREIQIERKRFLATLKENPSGRFLRITECAGDKSNTIIIPASGLRSFSKLLQEMLQAAANPPGNQPQPAPVEPAAHPDADKKFSAGITPAL